MKRTRCCILALVVLGLTAWSSVMAQSDADRGGSGDADQNAIAPQPDQSESMGLNLPVDISSDREAGMSQGVRSAATQPALAKQGRAALPSRQMQPRGEYYQSVPSQSGQAGTILGFRNDVFMPSEPWAQARRQAYIQDSHRRGEFVRGKEPPVARSGPIRWSQPTAGRFIRNPDVYGYEETEAETGTTTEPGTVERETKVEHKTKTHEKHRGCDGKEMSHKHTERTHTDYFRASKDQDDYYYTRYWAVDEPPVQVHARFQTIYDSAVTDNYYSPWIGTNAEWSPNAMVAAPMPRPSGQWHSLSKDQLVTNFTPWRNEIVSDKPEPFAMIGSSGERMAFRNQPGAVYGYRGGEIYGFEGTISAEGSFRSKSDGQTMFWDDHDLLATPSSVQGALNYGYVAPAPSVFGYVAPNIGGSFNPGTTFRDRKGQEFKAEPDSKDVKNYGKPGGAVR